MAVKVVFFVVDIVKYLDDLVKAEK